MAGGRRIVLLPMTSESYQDGEPIVWRLVLNSKRALPADYDLARIRPCKAGQVAWLRARRAHVDAAECDLRVKPGLMHPEFTQEQSFTRPPTSWRRPSRLSRIASLDERSNRARIFGVHLDSSRRPVCIFFAVESSPAITRFAGRAAFRLYYTAISSRLTADEAATS